MPAAQYDLTIPAGGTVDLTVEVVGGPASLDGATALMHIRELRDDLVPLATVGAEHFTFNSSARLVTVKIPSSLTETWEFRRGVYDVRVTAGGDDWIVVEGRIKNKLAVTRGA